MKPVPILDYGPNRLKEWSLELKEAIDERTPIPDNITIKSRQTGNGILLEADPPAPAFSFTAPFQILATTDGAVENPQPRVRVKASQLGGGFPNGMNSLDNPPFLLVPMPGTVKVWLRVKIDPAASGALTERTIDHGPTLPADTKTEFHYELGGYIFETPEGETTPRITKVNNVGYGPVAVQACRNWFAAEVSYSVTFFFAGSFPA